MPWRTIGQEPARRLLDRSVFEGRVAHAYLFTGPANVGKTTLALDFARSLLCNGDRRPCDACPACRMVLGQAHPDLEQLESEDGDVTDFSALWTPGVTERPARALPVERIRQLIGTLATRPTASAYRVATLDGSGVQETAASALLKLFEEPSPHTVLLLRAIAVESLPPPVVSRCQVVRLRAVPSADIAAWLQSCHGVPADAAWACAAWSRGRPGLAKRLSELPDAGSALDDQVAQWLELRRADTVARLDRAAVWGKSYTLARAALDVASVTWHALVRRLSRGALGEPEPTGIPSLDRELARGDAPDVATIGRQLAAISRASRLLDANAQPRLALEWVLLEL